MKKRVITQITKDPIVNRNNQAVADAFNSLVDKVLTGIRVEANVSSAQDTLIEVGFEAQGWVILDKNVQADIWKVSQTNRTITLRASSDVSVALFILGE